MDKNKIYKLVKEGTAIFESEINKIYDLGNDAVDGFSILKICKMEEPSSLIISLYNREFQHLKKFDCPYIIKAKSLTYVGKRPGLLLENIQGISIKEFIASTQKICCSHISS